MDKMNQGTFINTCKHKMKNKDYEVSYYDHDDEEEEESVSSHHHCMEVKDKSRYTCIHHVDVDVAACSDRKNMKNRIKSCEILFDHDDQDERKIREIEEIPDLEDNIKGNLKPKATVQKEDIESLGNSMSLKEAVLNINNEFKHLFDFGREFSSIIGADKLPYHSVNSKLKSMISDLSAVTSKIS